MSTRKITSPAMEVIQGEMYIFGEKLPRHPEFPWLFSATALHKSCEEAIKIRATQDGKDPEKFYEAKRPAQWIRFNILAPTNKERVEHYANHTRTRIKKYGPNLGFGLTARNLTVKIDEISDLDLVLQTKAGRYGGGSYLCQLAIVKYIETFSEKFRATVQNSFISMVNGEVETVTEQVEESARKARGTKELEQCKDSSTRLIKACAEKGIRNTLKVQQGINEGILGMPGEKYRKANGLPKPLNDNLTVQQVNGKMYANLYAADEISADERPVIPHSEAKPIGVRAGIFAKLMGEDVAFKKAIAERVAAEEKLHNARMEKYKSKVKARRSVKRKAG